MAHPDISAAVRSGTGSRQRAGTDEPGRHAGASVALYLAGRPRRPEDARGLVGGAAVGGEGCHAGGAFHLQMGDRCPDRRGYRAGAILELDAVGRCLADHHDARLWRLADPDGRVDPVARRNLRARGDARGAEAGLSHLHSHARIVVALSSGAQDRRIDARAGAWPQRHRDHRADGDPATRSDHRRGHAADGGAAVEIRLALCGRNPDHGRDLHVLHLHRDRVADRNPPQDERFRHRGEHQGDRLAPELRDREIFRRRGA